MTNSDLTLLGFIVDHSGSMASCKEDMEGGLNTLVKEQKEQPGPQPDQVSAWRGEERRV